MDFKYIFLAAVVCFLVPVEAGRRRPRSISLQSVFRQHDDNCKGNLLKIHIDGSGSQAKCDGTSTKSLTTQFMIKATRGKKCIQYIDKQGGTTRYYALKVINGTKVTFMNERCDSSTADAFLFVEEKKRPYRYYRHTLPNNTKLYLGVSSNCADDRLSLICSNFGDRRCTFRWRS